MGTSLVRVMEVVLVCFSWYIQRVSCFEFRTSGQIQGREEAIRIYKQIKRKANGSYTSDSATAVQRSTSKTSLTLLDMNFSSAMISTTAFIIMVAFCQGTVLDKTSTNFSCSLNSTTNNKKPDTEKIITSTLAVVLASDMMHYVKESERREKAITNCQNLNGSFIESTQDCVRYEELTNKSQGCHKVTYIDKNLFILDIDKRQHVEYTMHLTGNALSIISLVLLLITYLINTELHTSYGRSVVLLSLNTLLLQIFQILSLELKEKDKFCFALAVMQHWSYLVVFTWMASIAFDISATFSRIRQPSAAIQMRRFKLYTMLSEISPTVVVAACLALDACSGKSFIGYGKNNICFITNFLANILAFSLPVAGIIIFNIICLFVTLIFIARARRNSRSILGPKRTRSQEAMTFVIMTLKLSFFFGFGWIFGPIGRITRSVNVLYVYIFFSSFQGVFIFIAFCINTKVIQFYKSKLAKIAPKPRRLQDTGQSQDTHL
ncbi:adhesion G protein-coupled receptor L4-like [Rhopilema esculentum]|uniref:adhesion G protein-coupled receptor L4-like n=1 Tax=Rhopilema esculentum TaxID=499914 RepID=UPI0031D8DEEB